MVYYCRWNRVWDAFCYKNKDSEPLPLASHQYNKVYVLYIKENEMNRREKEEKEEESEKKKRRT